MTTETDSATPSLEAADDAVVVLQPRGSKPPLFCVHSSASNLRLLSALASHLAPEQPVIGVPATPSGDRSNEQPCGLDEFAQAQVRAIRRVQPNGPYLVLGECIAGALAYEVAQQLRADGEQVGLLAVVDSFAPGGFRLRPFLPWPAYRLGRLVWWILHYHLPSVVKLEGPLRKEFITTRLTRIVAALKARASRWHRLSPAEFSARPGFSEALAEYEPDPYVGRMVLFRGTTLPWGVRPTHHLGWGALVEQLDVIELRADFGTNMLEPAVRVLARRLAEELDATATGEPAELTPAIRVARSIY